MAIVLKCLHMWFIGLVTVLLVLVIVGCSRDGDVPDDEVFSDAIEVIETGSGVDDSQTLESEGSSKQGEPRRGGVFMIGTGNGTIPDPALGFTASSMIMFAEIYSGLFKLVDDSQNLVQPDLASSYTVSEDGTAYHIILKQGLKFSDGSPVVASDFKWSWERALDPELGSTTAIDVLGNIAGASAVIEGVLKELSGVEVIDDRTLRIELDSVQPTFLARLAEPVASVLKRDNVENWEIDWSKWREFPPFSSSDSSILPVGTGPFKLSRLDFLGNTLIVRNEHYHDRLAYLDGVELYSDYLKSENDDPFVAIASAFDKRILDVDYLPHDQSADAELYETVKYIELEPVTEFLSFNSALAPYDDAYFREAIVVASDIHSLAESFGYDVASGLLPPGTPSFSADTRNVQYDPARVTDLITKSGYDAEDIKLRFETQNIEAPEGPVDALMNQWNIGLGVDARISVLDATSYDDLLRTGRLQMNHVSIGLHYNDPHSILGVFESQFGPASSDDIAQVQEMLAEALHTADTVDRYDLYSDIEQFILDRALALPMFWLTEGYYIRMQPWVHGYTIPKHYGSRFKDVWFDETAPTRDLMDQ